ncbi:chorismate mutase [Vararia minispora EC-137]|uniref:Chorismate mutase n=1 Tax=Vararia minispora EC-137 TaxID=1314806 RepID=A0ACB8QXZ6_9AGAM|nr:chorismate mutase [Vararia minispora EC-137]
MQSNYFRNKNPLDLDHIRSVLTRLEDTIIFGLIERAQFAHNHRIYLRGGFPELVNLGFTGSWLEWFLKETESFHAKARRYTSPDEYPFTPPAELPTPVLPSLAFPRLLHPNTVNANPSILAFYTRSIVPRITHDTTLALAASRRATGVTGDAEAEDDGNYGSAATIDVEVLQAISKRVHYGKFVSESKFADDPAAFIPHIRARNTDALAALITKPEVEKRLLQRLRKKAALYAQDFASDGEPLPEGKGKIDVSSVVDLYESYIIPLTKEVEVDYLLQRLDGLSEEDIERLMEPKGLLLSVEDKRS